MKGYKISIPASMLLFIYEWKAGIGYFVGYSFHRWCDNDLDLMGVSGAEGRMVNELPLIGHLMFGASSAYGSLFRKKHRSFWTHFPVVSTLIRLVFFFTVPFIFLDSWGINLIGGGWVWFWLGFFAGLSHADGVHYTLDLLDLKE